MDLLIQNGADLDFRLRDTRMTLLHVVCESKYADADSLKVLIRNGGLDANASTRFLKSTPLMIAIESLPADIAVDIAETLIENGANVNAGDDFNETALHNVSKQDDEYAEVADVLIRNGAVVNAVNVDKVSALHYAAQHGNVKIVKRLIRGGCDVDAVDKHGWRPLHQAAFELDDRILKVFIENGADVNAVTHSNTSALFLAQQHRSDRLPRVLKMLIVSGASVNAVEKNVYTAFHGAIQNKRMRSVLYFLCMGAAIDRRALELEDPDEFELLHRIKNRTLSPMFSPKEMRFLQNLALILVVKNRSVAYRVYHIIYKFDTYKGIFMGPEFLVDGDEECFWDLYRW